MSAYLDRLAIEIRLKHGKAISRAEIIRGLIEAAFQSGIDLTQADSIDTLDLSAHRFRRREAKKQQIAARIRFPGKIVRERRRESGTIRRDAKRDTPMRLIAHSFRRMR